MTLSQKIESAFEQVGKDIKQLSQSGFLPPPTHHEITETHFYFGWSDTGLIQRQNRSDAGTQSFQSASFSTDWTNRVNLGYS